MDEQKMIKTDINFLEWPNWMVNRRSVQKKFVIEKQHGRYEIFSALGFPKHFDKVVVYFLLYKLGKETAFEEYSIHSTRYEIAKNIFGGSHFSANAYDRIMDALLRWKAITIKFKGVFYEGDRYTIRAFSIIDEFVLDPSSGQLTVKFSEAYVKQLKETQFYRYIDFEQFKKLHRDLSARLYEILVKNFKDRKTWPIGIELLAEKLTLEKHAGTDRYYPSEILRKIKPALNEINKKTDLFVSLEYNSTNSTCVFNKQNKQKEIIPAYLCDNKRKKNLSDRHIDAYYKYYLNLPQDERLRIIKAVSMDNILSSIADEKIKVVSYMKRANLLPKI